MPVYRPSAQVRLQLRLDNYTEQGRLASSMLLPTTDALGGASVAASAVDALAENQAQRTMLGSAKSKLSGKEFGAQKAALDASRSAIQNSVGPKVLQKPEGLSGGTSDEETVVFTVLPQSCSIERNNIVDPDTAEVILDYKDVPLDPRIIRSCLITITIGTVDAGSYRDGVVSRQVRDSDGMLTSVVERQPDEELRFGNTQSRFVGFVDEWEIELGESGDQVVLKCRDVSALLKDDRLPSGVAIDLSMPIVSGIEDLLARDDDFGKPLFPSARGMKVYFGLPTELGDVRKLVEDKGPVPGELLAVTQKVRKGKQAKSAKSGDHEDSLWDHIVVTAQKMGLVPFVRGFVLFLAKPETIYGQIEGGRKMVYGRNLSELKFTRKLGGVMADTIEIRSFDPDIGRTRWARYPVLNNEPSSGILNDPNSPQPVTSRPNKLSPTGKPTEAVKVFSVPRIVDLEVLQSVARQTFEQIARQEIEGSFTTEDLDSFRDPTEESNLPSADLLELMPGDPVTILVAPMDPTTVGDPFAQVEKSGKDVGVTSQEIASFTQSRRQQYLQGLGMSPKTAARIAKASEQIPLANTFKAAYVNIDYSVDDGVTIECSFYNYITVREEEGATPTGSVSGSITEAAKKL